MRVLSGKSRKPPSERIRVHRVSPCINVRHHGRVAGLRPHTRNFDDEHRRRLGVAVSRAREAAGYPARPAFQDVAGVGKTSLFYLENGDPVGAAVYEAVARALPGWTEDTPVQILEGGPIPSTGGKPPAPTPPPTDEWTEADEQRYRLLRDMLRSQGLEMTPRALRIMKEEFDRLEAESRAGSQATQGERP